MDEWQTIIISITSTVGGIGALTAALAWLAKSFINSQLQRDLETHKANLVLQNQMALERIRADVIKFSQEHQIQFSKLHEKRAQVISEMHGILVDMEEATSEFKSSARLKEGASSYVKNVQTIAKESVKCRKFLLKNSLYFERELVEKLEHLVSHSLIVSIVTTDTDSEDRKEITEEEKVRHNKMLTEIQETKEMIETEFRKLLGVSVNEEFRLKENQNSEEQ